MNIIYIKQFALLIGLSFLSCLPTALTFLSLLFQPTVVAVVLPDNSLELVRDYLNRNGFELACWLCEAHFLGQFVILLFVLILICED